MPPVYDGPGRIKGTDPRVRATTDRIGRGYQTADAYARAQAPISDGRTLQQRLDEIEESRGPRRDVQAEQQRRGGMDSRAELAAQDDFAKRLGVAAETQAGKVRPAAVRGSGQVQLGWDDDPKQYGWHYSPAENAEGIRERGFDPDLKGRHGPGAKGVHFADSPDTYRPIGDQDWNVYRVRREHIPNPANVSSDDFYTGSRIPPEQIEAYQGPGRFGKLADHASTLGLLGMLATFIPGVEERFPWASRGGLAGDALNYTIQQNWAPGGVMDPYKDMRDLPGFNPQTGTVMA